MGEIIKFNPQYRVKSKEISDKDRYKAMAKGKYEVYVCEDCGGDIEVIDEQFPSTCPHCGTEILGWNE